MTTIQEQIALLQAVLDGKTLQYRNKHRATNVWIDAPPVWHQNLKAGIGELCITLYNWRIKPEPEVKWLNLPADGTALAYSSEQAAMNSGLLGLHTRIAVKFQEVL